MNKKTLRDTYLHKRKTLSKQEFEIRNAAIAMHFSQLTFEANQCIHVFLPIQKNAEVNTWNLITWLQQLNVKITISKSSLRTNTMEHFLFTDKASLSVNKWGIPEPSTGERVDEKDIDAVLIPLIVFDLQGHRIGYGKGYYDRFLASCKHDVRKIGLSITPPLDKIEFADNHDVIMDECVTHLGTYRFKRNGKI